MNRNLILTISLLVLTGFARPLPHKTRVFLAGDSTMCWYEADRAPLTGWGMPFAFFFDSTVSVENRARGGRSTRTFLAEGRWQGILDSLDAGDYVLIQFGHNDEAREEKYRDRYTPVPDFKRNLEKIVREARDRKAFPVLLTPVSRLRFDSSGLALETHAEYSAAVKEVASALSVPLIDLDTRSRQLYQQLGPVFSKFLFMQLEPGQHPNYPEGQKDNTHFNEYGARRVAELVLSGIRELHLPLVEKIVKGMSR